MAYLSEENTEMYRRMLSADTERGPVQSGLFNPPPRTAEPTAVSSFVKRKFPAPGPVMTKQITVTGTTTAQGVGGGTSEVAPKPKSFIDFPQNQFGPPRTSVEGGTAASLGPEKSNFMPLVYIGGAGLLLYFLLKK